MSEKCYSMFLTNLFDTNIIALFASLLSPGEELTLSCISSVIWALSVVFVQRSFRIKRESTPCLFCCFMAAACPVHTHCASTAHTRAPQCNHTSPLSVATGIRDQSHMGRVVFKTNITSFKKCAQPIIDRNVT